MFTKVPRAQYILTMCWILILLRTVILLWEENDGYLTPIIPVLFPVKLE